MPKRRSDKRASAWQSAAPAFAALGDETRLRIVGRLCEQGPQSIASLTEGSAVSRQAITKHLRLMQDAGLLRSERQGRQTVFELEPRRLEQARRHLDQISKQWDQALERLRALVEDDAQA